MFNDECLLVHSQESFGASEGVALVHSHVVPFYSLVSMLHSVLEEYWIGIHCWFVSNSPLKFIEVYEGLSLDMLKVAHRLIMLR